MDLCHRCDNPPCCNVRHLFIGTRHDNVQDMILKGRSAQSKRTRCPYGHEYAGWNLIIRKSGARTCRSCNNRRVKEMEARKRLLKS